MLRRFCASVKRLTQGIQFLFKNSGYLRPQIRRKRPSGVNSKKLLPQAGFVLFGKRQIFTDKAFHNGTPYTLFVRHVKSQKLFIFARLALVVTEFFDPVASKNRVQMVIFAFEQVPFKPDSFWVYAMSQQKDIHPCTFTAAFTPSTSGLGSIRQITGCLVFAYFRIAPVENFNNRKFVNRFQERSYGQ